MSLGWLAIYSLGKRLLQYSLRYERKYGKDENAAEARCLYAAKFISANDPTGEQALKHWISVGQLQDLHTASIDMNQFQYVDVCISINVSLLSKF